MKKLLWIGISTLLVIAIFLFTEVYLFLNSTPSFERSEQIVSIPAGTPFRKIAKELKLKGVITNEFKFYILSRYKGNLTKIKAGEYLLYTNLKPLEVLDIMVSGRTYLYRVTIPEGYNMVEVSKIVSALGLVTEEDFLKKAVDPILINHLQIRGVSVEGYLFPETYYFSKPVTSEKIIETMVKRFKENYTDAISFKAQKLGLSQLKVVTLASIIEKETGIPEERRLISSVFQNRLRLGMKLQSDPTVIYGIFKSFSGNLTKKDLQTSTPFNTYTHLGLPLGPIANPGRESLDAAVSPAPSNYIFFVSKNDGSHVFTTNYKDHLKAVNQYQRK